MVRDHGDGGVQGDALTELGFLYLFTIFIQRGRLDTTWTVLRKFGYAEDLRLTEAFLAPWCVFRAAGHLLALIQRTGRFDVPSDCSVELSHVGYDFFTSLFEANDKDRDGALNAKELESLFSTAPGSPWAGTVFPDTIIADDSGSITLQGWLAQWRYGPCPQAGCNI